MLKRIVAFVLVSMFCLTLPVFAATSAKIVGNGTSKSFADIAKISVAIVTDAEDAKTAQLKNKQLFAEMQEALSGLKVPPEDISTQNFQIEPLLSNKGKNITGYRAYHQIEVVCNISETSLVMATITQFPNVRIYGIFYDLKKPNEAKEKALQDALQNAMGKAEAIRITLRKNNMTVKNITEGVPPKSLRSVELSNSIAGHPNDSAAPLIAPAAIVVDAVVQIQVDFD